jgi:signal transduction histidine kinase
MRLDGLSLAYGSPYLFRLQPTFDEMRARFEERVAERTRIAQDLHDTVLQGIVSAAMQLDVAVDQLPENSPAKLRLSHVLELMRHVMKEARKAVRGLRSSNSDPDSDSDDLGQAFSRIPQDLGIEVKIDFRVIVLGSVRKLHPLIRDEAYHIGRELLVNAFRHSRANYIVVELEYAPRRLRIVVRDDGCGIDPQVLRAGREGHWGLPGMRERAQRVGASLRVWSRASAGTEVALSVPGSIAFESRIVEK